MRFFICFAMIVIFYSCKKQEKSQPEINENDSLLKAYIDLNDRLGCLKRDASYVILKMQLEHDTDLAEQLEAENSRLYALLMPINQYKNYPIEKLSQINASEIYRFSLLSISFVPFEIVITASNYNDTAFLLSTIKNITGDKTGYRSNDIVDEMFKPINSIKPIQKTEWDSLLKLINGSFFWSLYSLDDINGYDGLRYFVEGKKLDWDKSYWNEGKPIYMYHLVYRWSPEKGTFADIGYYLMNLSGFSFYPVDLY